MARKDGEQSRLLSNNQYDDDAPDVDTARQRTDDDDLESIEGRPSGEIADHDREVLDDDYEDEQFLAGGKSAESSSRKALRRIFKSDGEDRGGSRSERQQARRNTRRSRRRKRLEGENELMFEMEEGGRLNTSSEEEESKNSSQEDLKILGDVRGQKAARRRRVIRKAAIYVGIIVLFLFLLWAASRATKSTRVTSKAQKLLSNGTALFAPTTILISLDGFRADFLMRDITPTLHDFITGGVSPLYMLPSFPSVTFPNHYTMATGLYPEAHGIVGNTFWDPNWEEEFYYTHNEVAQKPKWWGGEPVWVTAETQGVRTAIHMWPGSEAHIAGVEPSNVDKYNGSEALTRKVDMVMGYIDLPGQEHKEFATMEVAEQRPQLIAAYVPVVDRDGHKYGPNSTEIRQTISDVDNMLALLMNHLQERNLTQMVNVVIVSDHGMATTDVTRLMQLEDLVDTSKIEHIDGWPLYGLRPKDPNDLQALHDQLVKNTKDNPNVEVYLRDKDMPERYHFSQNPRIAPLWLVPKTGWAIVTKEEFDVKQGLKNGDIYHPRGLHGYDHEHPLMRAIFIAQGPAFPHTPNSRVDVFQNTEVYNIICDSIGITPAPNNGTLRLPLKPVGLHSDADSPKAETPVDPPTHTLPSSASITANPPSQTPPAASGTISFATTTLPWGGTPTETPTAEEDDGKKNRIGKWWQWLTDKLNGAKDWAKGVFGGKDKNKGDGTSDG